MASSSLGFSGWRRRATSLTSQVPPRNEEQQQRNDGEDDDGNDNGRALGTESSNDLAHPFIAVPPPRPLSSSVDYPSSRKEPIRSFIHTPFREYLAPVDGARNAQSVRRDTAELASYLLSDGPAQQRLAFLQSPRSSYFQAVEEQVAVGKPTDESRRADMTIPEVSEPLSSDEPVESDQESGGPSVLSNLLRRSPRQASSRASSRSSTRKVEESESGQTRVEAAQTSSRQRERDQMDSSERTPLLRRDYSDTLDDSPIDLERQKNGPRKSWFGGWTGNHDRLEQHIAGATKTAPGPRSWNKRAIWKNAVVEPLSCLPAVAVGLLLNILDALSYGMILFPLGTPLFSHLGSAGISIYYVSTIIAQLVFSTGSIFKGAVGSELIEVVPFFHNMAARILSIVGEENPDAVIATTIVSYAISSMMTGGVFYLMGRFKFGYMIGFIPRHILIGCVGGVGWFLVATGVQVSARLEGNLEYNLDTLRQLVTPSAIPLWITPLALAVILFYFQSRGTSKYFLPLFILAIPLVFYFFVFAVDVLDPTELRKHGWIYVGPPPDEPWWYFYTLYKFNLVHWQAIVQVVPAMLALTFFSLLHVPINVPTLALNSGEDNADLDKELKLHGYSNFLSGCAGSIQNYLVYANTVFFLRSGGNKRLAGYMLAVLTLSVMMIGPSLISWIPVMMVGTLIFDLGFELLNEAVWLPRKKLKAAEYATVIVIVLVMGIYDFVVGIGVGILLAFVSLVIQTSQVSAVRGTYSGQIVSSTVRRNASQDRYLHQAGRQIYIMKLSGYLFFGTVASVEAKIRELLGEHAFSQSPIKFLILDLWRVTGLDYSAGEAFNTISRLLEKKGVHLVLSGLSAEGEMGQNLRAVGLGSGKIEVTMLPDLNSALESCENELLKTLYAHQEALNATTKRPATASLDVPTATGNNNNNNNNNNGGYGSTRLSSFDPPFNSPRQSYLAEAACEALATTEVQRRARWQSFNEPLRLMLQVFQGLSSKNEDFWFPAARYFARKEYAAGTTLFRRGEAADGFYLVEGGILRAEYDLPQGWLCESIVAGTTCGELPFFSETERTATVQVDKDCVVWVMDRRAWGRLQEEEGRVAGELLRISLKLTSERMSAITSYVLTTAG